MALTAPAQSLGRRLLWYHLPVVLYAAAIASLSAIPNLSGPKLSDFGGDKLIHCLEYGIFTWLILRSLESMPTGVGRTGLILFAIGLAAAYAGLDEYLQSFVPGRDSSVADFAADTVGSVLVALVWRSKKGQV
ncbi:MAG: VanZ family protein [bacterium]|nr:VanZ family protein [bacterium]